MDQDTCPSPPAPVNYKSDFAFYLDLYAITGYDAEGKPVLEPIGFPEYDWVATFTTVRMSVPFTASSKGGVLTNCRNDNGRILIVANKHNLCPGRLSVDFRADLPSDLYPDGTQLHALPSILDIELTRHAAPCPSAIEAKLILPYIKGEPFTYADFTPEQLAEIKRPATEAAEAANIVAGKALSAAKTADRLNSTIAEAEQLRQQAETQRSESEKARVANESDREKAEQLRKDAEQLRATEFAGWQDTLNGKQEQLQDSADITIKANNTLSITERAKRAVFDDLFRANAGSAGKIDHAHVNDDGTPSPYYLNELWLTYGEAKDVDAASRRAAYYGGKATGSRTLYPINWECSGFGSYPDANAKFHQNKDIETVRFSGYRAYLNNPYYTFYKCSRLRKIFGSLTFVGVRPANINTVFVGCYALEHIEIYGLSDSMSFADSPLLSLASLKCIVSNAANSSPITVAVHPYVYSKLTDEANAEWFKVLTDAVAKNISFATTVLMTTTGVGLRLKNGEHIDGGYLDDDFTIDLASVEAIYVDTPKIRRYIMPLADDVCFSDGSTKCPGIDCGEDAFGPFRGKENSELLRATHTDPRWAVNVAYSTIIAGRHCWIPSMSEYLALSYSGDHIFRLLDMCGIDWVTSSRFWTSSVSNRSSMPGGEGVISSENNDTTRDYYLYFMHCRKENMSGFASSSVTAFKKILAMTDMD